MPQIKFCPHCLSAMPETAAVCPFCGDRLTNRNPSGTLPSGTVLNERYTIGAFVSNDGEGVLYQAVDHQGPTRVTIKEYLPVTLAEDRDAGGALRSKPGCEVLFKTTRMDFVDLYKELMKITPSTGLETVLDVVECNNTAYAVLENPGGVPLNEYLQQKGCHIPPAEARSMLQPVFEGVAAMHQAGLMHRGISPDNIRVEENGKARLSGYATVGLRRLGSALHAHLYEGYSAPEQYDKAEFEGRYTDSYALAAVFYRMVTGQPPMPSMQRRVMDTNPAARNLDASLPAWLSQVLEQALEMNPKDRIQTVNTLMSSLTSATAAQALRKNTHKTERHRNQVVGMLSVLILGVCVLIVLSLWGMMQPGGPLAKPTPAPTAVPTPEPVVEKEYMPDFIGMTYSQIQTGGQYAGKYRFTLTEEYSDTVAAGVVMQQEPKENTEVQAGDSRIVTLTVSKGPRDVVLNNVVGFTQDSAVAEMQNQGLLPRCVMQANDGSYAVGCVIKTDPAAGEAVQPGSEVIIYIAAEPHLSLNNEEVLTMVATPQPEQTPVPEEAAAAAVKPEETTRSKKK